MDEKNQKALMQEAMRIAASPQGKQLISMLSQGQTDTLGKAMAYYQSGNIQEAKRLMNEVLSSPQGKKIMEQMGK